MKMNLERQLGKAPAKATAALPSRWAGLNNLKLSGEDIDLTPLKVDNLIDFTPHSRTVEGSHQGTP